MAERKVMVGPRVRRMRLERGLTQKKMAEELGISTSYLNLIERNQRPVTVQLLLKLGQSYDIDLQRFAVDNTATKSAGSNPKTHWALLPATQTCTATSKTTPPTPSIPVGWIS